MIIDHFIARVETDDAGNPKIPYGTVDFRKDRESAGIADGQFYANLGPDDDWIGNPKSDVCRDVEGNLPVAEPQPGTVMVNVQDGLCEEPSLVIAALQRMPWAKDAVLLNGCMVREGRLDAAREAVARSKGAAIFTYDSPDDDGVYTACGFEDWDEAILFEMAEAKHLREDRESSSMKLSRNSPCPCGSGKKVKRCCGLERWREHERAKSSWVLPDVSERDGSPLTDEIIDDLHVRGGRSKEVLRAFRDFGVTYDAESDVLNFPT